MTYDQKFVQLKYVSNKICSIPKLKNQLYEKKPDCRTLEQLEQHTVQINCRNIKSYQYRVIIAVQKWQFLHLLNHNTREETKAR